MIADTINFLIIDFDPILVKLKGVRTERFIYYRESVLHLLTRMFHLRLSRCSTDLLYILGHSVIV